MRFSDRDGESGGWILVVRCSSVVLRRLEGPSCDLISPSISPSCKDVSDGAGVGSVVILGLDLVVGTFDAVIVGIISCGSVSVYVLEGTMVIP